MGKTALMLMDFQNGIVGRVANEGQLLERVQKVKAAAKRAGMPIIYVVVKFRSGYPEISSNNKMFSGLASSGMPFQDGESATEVHPSLAMEAGDILVTKRRVGAFSGSDLDTVLRGQNVDKWVLTGIATSGVVLSTLRVAADMDFGITVIADCCADADEEVHRVLTEKVFPRQADVVTAEAWLSANAQLVGKH
ncbi:MAG TPA: isochorismatase family cysteine hydrolase [Planktothrix sp.]